MDGYVSLVVRWRVAPRIWEGKPVVKRTAETSSEPSRDILRRLPRRRRLKSQVVQGPAHEGPDAAETLPEAVRDEHLRRRVNDVDVLVVEDDEAVRSTLSEIMRNDGLSVVEAEDGFVALEHLRSTSIGVVLLDVNMPVLSGLALLDKLDDPPPVIILTARRYDNEIDRRRAKITGYLRKPSHPELVLAAVRSCL